MTAYTRSKNYWADFPVTYRAEQIAIITRWVSAGESGVVVGGSGTGKSNLAGFLAGRPDAIAPHLNDDPDSLIFLWFDINSLPTLSETYFYRGLIQTLIDASEAFGADLQQAMQQLTAGPANWNDIFFVLTTIRKAHSLFIDLTGKRIVWLLDRFDEACRQLDAQTLNSLRSMRDQFKGQLCFVVFTRHPLMRLRDPAEFDEFHEIVAANTCWVGPMVARDAHWIARQMAERLNTTFSKQDVTRLITVTGGLPAFMKLACLAIHKSDFDRQQSVKAWAAWLLTRLEFQRNCQEIWDDLTVEEQNFLLAVSSGVDTRQLDAEVQQYLLQTGLIISTNKSGDRLPSRVRVFSPVFEGFIKQQRGTAAGNLELHPKTRTVLRGGVPLNIELTAGEDRLLSFFLEHPNEICSKDTLMRTVWPDEKYVAGIRDDRLAQLVKRLRQKIEPEPARPAYIQTVRGQGYRFVQPGG
ncbi:MAG: winged helix family transcriptional regulator [Chloroflexi bacterium]|nr:MAG: winged helix family transcriptional regulator [Chloroflexota bacterium]